MVDVNPNKMPMLVVDQYFRMVLLIQLLKRQRGRMVVANPVGPCLPVCSKLNSPNLCNLLESMDQPAGHLETSLELILSTMSIMSILS